ncbi:MAG: DUF2721 domain-containing protein [Ignavibacteriales bacterium]|nr:DUF2721 domain-containing protein [Ignavibacteriales bacterium]MBI3786892.1 DUF2721 domain-containing protein [Ignavibacteriales bacterium]
MGTDLQENLSVIQVIQLILAPAVMINACGLLLLSTSNKYSLVLNRIRLLNDEKRKLFRKAGEKNFEENLRLESLTKQLGQLMIRAKLMRDAVLCYTGGVGLFVVTSLLIGLQFFNAVLHFQFLILGIFLLGMISMFLGAILAFLDAKRGYDIVQYDVRVEE